MKLKVLGKLNALKISPFAEALLMRHILLVK
jgi:hypothetical protein